jgi:hypothetical protein
MGEDSLMPGTPSGNTEWIVRELNRLDKQKADRLYVTGKLETLEKDVAAAKKAADTHPCLKEEDLSEMNATLAKLSTAHEDMMISQKSLAESQTFWSRWFFKGIIGFVVFLMGTGGVWVYSYFNIKDKSDEAQQVSVEVKTMVTEVQQTQKAQAETLKQVAAIKETRDDAARLQIRQELKQAVKEILADNAANR